MIENTSVNVISGASSDVQESTNKRRPHTHRSPQDHSSAVSDQPPLKKAKKALRAALPAPRTLGHDLQHRMIWTYSPPPGQLTFATSYDNNGRRQRCAGDCSFPLWQIFAACASRGSRRSTLVGRGDPSILSECM
jgi:hypothetical protein